MGGRSHDTDSQTDAVQSIGVGIIGAVFLLLCVSDQVGRLKLRNLQLMKGVGHIGHVIFFDGRAYGLGVGLDPSELVEQILKLVDGAHVLSHLNVFVREGSVRIHVRIRHPGDLFVGDLKEYALGSVDFHAVLKFTKGQNVTLCGLVYESLAGGRIHIDAGESASECKVSVVYPGDGHHLRPAGSRGSRAGFLTHGDAVALKRAAVGGLGAVGDEFRIPVNVGLADLLDIGGISAGCQDHALCRGHFDFRSIVLCTGNAYDSAAVIQKQLLGCCSQHDLSAVVKNRLTAGNEVSAPVEDRACARLVDLAVAVHVGAQLFVFSLPQRTDQGQLACFVKYGALVLEPFLQALAALDNLLYKIHISVDPLGLVSVLTKSAVVGLEFMKLKGREQGQILFLRSVCNLCVGPVKVSLDLFLQRLKDRKIFFVYAGLADLVDLACHIWILFGKVILVKGFFVPLKDGAEHVQISLCSVYDLRIALTVVLIHAFCRIRIVLVPYKIGHHGLILAARYKRVSADLGVLLDDQDLVAVLGCLCRGTDSGAARSDDDDVILAGDLLARFMLYGIQHKGHGV